MSYSVRKIFRYLRREATQVPLRKLFKATFLVTLAPFMILAIFTLFGKIPAGDALIAAAAVFLISIIFVTPYVRNLSALTHYVQQLSLDRSAAAPDLSFLSNVEELSEAVERLHWSWENRRNQLESLVSESKVLIDSLPDVLIMLDEYFSIIRTNKAARNIFGEDHIQKLNFILEKPEISQIIRETMEDGQGRNFEFSPSEYVNKEFVVSIEKIPMYSTSGIAIVVDMHDITELKLTEKMFADFVANASHEIRTPLTSIVGFIETLQNGAKDDPEALNNFLGVMSEQATRMSKLVRDLLSLSELERAIKNPPSEQVNIKEVLDSVKSHTAWNAQQKNITVSFAYKGEIPAIIGDSSQLTQVFDNLVNNSIKYGYDNSKVNIFCRMEDASSDSRRYVSGNPRKILCVSVTDQSEGIEEEHLPRLTERFYRVDKARSRKMGGTGLGLAIVKHILARHMGGLKIESTIGKGSTFTIILPVL